MRLPPPPPPVTDFAIDNAFSSCVVAPAYPAPALRLRIGADRTPCALIAPTCRLPVQTTPLTSSIHQMSGFQLKLFPCILCADLMCSLPLIVSRILLFAGVRSRCAIVLDGHMVGVRRGRVFTRRYVTCQVASPQTRCQPRFRQQRQVQNRKVSPAGRDCRTHGLSRPAPRIPVKVRVHSMAPVFVDMSVDIICRGAGSPRQECPCHHRPADGAVAVIAFGIGMAVNVSS